MGLKAKRCTEVKNFTDIPNVGPAIERHFVFLKLASPNDLRKQDPFLLYTRLCTESGVRHDPCVLDTFIAVVDFMNGTPSRPWFYYTKGRKRKYPNV